MKKATSQISQLKYGAVRAARFHFVILLLFTLQTVIFHAAKVAVPETVHERWLATSALFALAAIVWYVAKNKITHPGGFRMLIWLLIIADIAFAAFNVNLTRGYASNFVVLFFIPILVAAILHSRSALIATALLCAAAYAATIINYFFQNFNEGYMAELYGELALYSGLFLATALLLWTIIRVKHPS